MKYRIVVSDTAKWSRPILRDISIVFKSYDSAANYLITGIASGNQMYYNIVPVSD